MRSPNNGKARGAIPGPNPTQNRQHTPHEQVEGSRLRRRNSPVLAFAYAYPPCGRRAYWLLIVVSCPHCGGAHHHRGSRAGGRRQASCRQGWYVVRPHRTRRLAEAA
jgi:hypothetical protein